MRAQPSSKRAFTLIELLTVLAVIAILGCLLLPALARTRTRSYNAGCVEGLRQMMTGWAMYKDENKDYLVPNAPGGVLGWVQKAEGWNALDANTNPAVYYSGLLSPYIKKRIECYRCPADVIPSDNGVRLRSRSMNSQVGTTDLSAQAFNIGWQNYLKGGDLTCLKPKDLFVFVDESMYTLNDGFLQLDLNAPDYPDAPANYHDGACGFSFADGHAEIHKWQAGPSVFSGLLNVPYRYGIFNNTGQHWPSSVTDADYLWLRAHAACKVGQSFQQ